jgi:hypothetical protein
MRSPQRLCRTRRLACFDRVFSLPLFPRDPGFEDAHVLGFFLDELFRHGPDARYPLLQETPSADPAERTEWNVRDSDACLILIDASGVAVPKGTALTGCARD